MNRVVLSRARRAASCRRGRVLLGPFSFALLSLACSPSLPTIEESSADIAAHRARIDSIETALHRSASVPRPGKDIRIRVSAAMLNEIFSAFAGSRTDDLRIALFPTRPLVKEERSILGIPYTNYLDIDSGNVVVNLSHLRIERIRAGRVEASLRLEGIGRIGVSGKYTGVPAGAAPDLTVSLEEKVAFTVRATDSGTVLLVPVPQVVTIRARFSVKLLEWNVPWSKDIPVQLTDLVRPIELPIALRTDIPIPIPPDRPEGETAFRKVRLHFVEPSLKVDEEAITFSASLRILPP
ncbi:MAG: hypothetical protein QHI48_10255 [Bacteroidota bacterium]|nr:hypothetical protein [Bacteroidota bacterium]